MLGRTTSTYKDVICLFIFSFYNSKCLKWQSGVKNRRRLRCTHRVGYESSINRFFSVLLSRDWYRVTSRNWIILVPTRFSTFASLVKGHLKEPNHMLLDFCKSHLGHLKAPNHFKFSLLLCFHESGTTQALFYLTTLNSLTQVQRPEQRNILLLFCRSSSFPVRLCWGRNLPWFIQFPGRPHNPCRQTSHLRVAWDAPLV